MSFYADPSFYMLAVATVLVASAVGLASARPTPTCEREVPPRRLTPLTLVGALATALFLTCLFFRTLDQAMAAGTFLAIAGASTWALRSNPQSTARFFCAVAATVAPLVCYKVTDAFGLGLWGFVGISYLTFKAVQVQMEIRDGLIGPRDMNAAEYLYFLAFFPTFTSGPIDRSRRFVADIRHTPTRDEYAGMLARGILLVLAGMAYKLVLAGIIHRFYSPAAWGAGPLPTELATQISAAYLYAGYLFFDFAGYSLMAQGLGYCLGVRVPRNFRAPFIARDPIDFWNRWHITLSTWLRDFVFMRFMRTALRRKLLPSRLATAQAGLVLNMGLMGVWHGITPDYIAYGLFHGVLLAATEGYQKKSAFHKRHRNARWYKVASWAITLQLVVFGFALFSGQVGKLCAGLMA